MCVLTGFSSGSPLYLLLNLVPARPSTEGWSLKAIGAFALIQFPYTWKFLWSPPPDRYALPRWAAPAGWPDSVFRCSGDRPAAPVAHQSAGTGADRHGTHRVFVGHPGYRAGC